MNLSAIRPLEIAAFLDQQGWGDAATQVFDGDFSPRRYMRLTKPDGSTAILMDADADQKTPQFITIAELLRKSGITTPHIYAAEGDKGLVLMQDFGTRPIGGLLDTGAEAKVFYLRAADILAKLHKNFNRADATGVDMPLYSTELFVAQVSLFLDGYFPFAKQRDATEQEREDFTAAWRSVLRPIETMPKSLLLRDFMPDNLMDLPKDEIGVLDFQDAGIGCVAYDLASLCEEVRRDGGFALLPEVIAHYREKSGTEISQNDLMRAAVILSAQRHTRIVGIISQMALRQGRRDKLAYLPRITKHLNTILQQPYLFPVREFMNQCEGLV